VRLLQFFHPRLAQLELLEQLLEQLLELQRGIPAPGRNLLLKMGNLRNKH
jgi:hypothetical protein